MGMVAVLGALTLGGCAGKTTAEVNLPSDLRNNVAVTDAAPRLLVAGPTRLLHANYDRRAGVVFSRVSLHGAGAPDCRAAVPLDWDGESDLDVRAGELICVGAIRRVNLSWHASTRGAEILDGTRHASLR